jgi:hypothetical protein
VEDIGKDREQARQIAPELAREGAIVLNFGDRHPNPHILAFEPESPEEQLLKNFGGSRFVPTQLVAVRTLGNPTYKPW